TLPTNTRPGAPCVTSLCERRRPMKARSAQSVCLAALAASSVWLAPGTSRAAIIVTAEAPGVQASTVPGVLTVDFNDLAPGQYTVLSSPIGTYTAPAPGVFIRDSDQFGGPTRPDTWMFKARSR